MDKENKLTKSNINRKLNIMIVVEGGLEGGGVQTRVSTFIKYLQKRGHKVIVVRFGRTKINNLKNGEYSLTYDLPYYFLTFRNKIGALFQILKMLNIIKKEEVDIMHVHDTYPTIFGFIASKIKRIPIVCTIHGIFYYNPLYFFYISLFHNGFNKIITISEEIKKYLEKKRILENKIRVIPNAIDLDHFILNTVRSSLKKGDLGDEDFKVVTYIGRLAEDKIDACLASVRAMQIVIETIRNIRMVIVGGGRKKEKIKREVEKINSRFNRDIIQMVGEQNDILPYIRASDIIIGAGRVALEAMAAGKPVVLVSNQACGGYVNPQNIKEISNYNFTGRNLTEKPTPKKVAQSILTLVRDEKLCRKISLFSKEYVKEHHDVKKLVDILIRIYKENIPDV